MKTEMAVPLFDLATCISDTVDLMSPEVANHHMRVAYIAWSLAGELGWERQPRTDLLMAGLFHDVGGFSQEERVRLSEFEVHAPHQHARVGQRLLECFPPFDAVARLVRFHHVPWGDGAGVEFEGQPVPEASLLLHLADRAAVLLRPDHPPLRQIRDIRDKLRGLAPKQFIPQHVEAFCSLAGRDYFWIDVVSPGLNAVLRRRTQMGNLRLDLDTLEQFAGILRRMIDFRSRFTSTHSSGVAATAAALARMAGFDERECRLMLLAGHLHDVGKLAIPQEILQKPARLDEDEYDVMRSHVYHTYRILEPVAELDVVRTWGALHQECLDGSGYPFRLKGEALPLGSRVMAVADVFTALTEDRPYRAGLGERDSASIMERLATLGKVDGELIALMRRNFAEFNSVRVEAQRGAVDEYDRFISSLS